MIGTIILNTLSNRHTFTYPWETEILNGKITKMKHVIENKNVWFFMVKERHSSFNTRELFRKVL